MLNDGDTVPALSIHTDDGGRLALPPKDRPVVLYFYPKDDTSGCTIEAKDFNSLSQAFGAAGVTVVGVSPDSVESHVKFKKKHDLHLTLAADTDKAAAEAFGVWIEKSMYGRKYMGVDRSTFIIDKRGRILRSWRKVKVAGHAEAVLAAVRELVG